MLLSKSVFCALFPFCSNGAELLSSIAYTSRVCVYVIAPRRVGRGGQDFEPDIKLSGDHIAEKHCMFEIKEDGKVL